MGTSVQNSNGKVLYHYEDILLCSMSNFIVIIFKTRKGDFAGHCPIYIYIYNIYIYNIYIYIGLVTPHHALHHVPLVTQHHVPLVTQHHVPLVTQHHVPLATQHHVPLVSSTGHPTPCSTGHPTPCSTGHPTPCSTGHPTPCSSGHPTPCSTGLCRCTGCGCAFNQKTCFLHLERFVC